MKDSQLTRCVFLKKSVVLVILLLLGTTAFSLNWINNENLDIQGKAFFKVYQDIIEDTAVEDHQAVDMRLVLEQYFKFSEPSFTWKSSFEGRSEVYIGDDTQKDWSLSLREAFFEQRGERHIFSVGRQVVTWGKLDDITILDRVNPQDFSWFALVDKQKRKDPVFMVRYAFKHDPFLFEGVFIPFFRASRLDYFGSDWGLFDHLKEEVRNGNYNTLTKSVIADIRIEDDDGLDESDIAQSQFAARFNSRVRDIDYALYYLYLYQSIPTLREKTPTGNIVKQFLFEPTAGNLAQLLASTPTGDDYILVREHPRLHVIGADFETVFGAFGVRGEYAFLTDVGMIRDNFSYVTKDMMSFGIGVDHTTVLEYYFNVQFIEDIVVDYENLYVQEKYSHQVTGNLRKSFYRGKLQFDADCAYNISYGDRMFNPELSWNFDNGISVTVGAFFFEGRVNTLFGRFSDKDVVYTGLNYYF